MYQEEKTFNLRFSLEAAFPEDYEGDDDHLAWLREWEATIKPLLLTQVFQALRQQPAWTSRIRNRGISPMDEIEIVLARDFSKPIPFRLTI